MNPQKIKEAFLLYEKDHGFPNQIEAVPAWRKAKSSEERRLAYWLSVEQLLIKEGYL